MGWGFGYRPYVSVAQRRAKATHKMHKLRKQGIDVQPVQIEGRKIAHTFWGQSWCQHLESFSDYENRLPRGRTYVRNGSVCHLEIAGGEVKAIVSGSELYNVKIEIKQLAQTKWSAVKQRCSGKIGSLLELLQGRLSNSVMTVVTDRHEGLFPLPSEIKLDCSCPDWAVMCKHVAAVLYGVGARLDEKPELLFILRGVDHEELIAADAVAAASLIGGKQGGRRIAESDLEGVFGIEMLAEESSSNGRHRTKPGNGAPEKREARHSGSRKQNGIDAGIQPIKQKTSSQAIKNKKSSQPTTRKTEMFSGKTTGTKSTGHAVSTANDLFPIGETIKELRNRLDLTQSQLALLIGVSAASVSNWERKRGRLNLQPHTISALESVTQLTTKQALRRLAKA
jgi:uncharacterized Zn finger protein/DNA-binding transcriptional regulator YiaG